MVPVVDSAAVLPSLFGFPLRDLFDGELEEYLRDLSRLTRRLRSLRAELVAEAERRGVKCRPKLGVREILALSLEPEPFLTPPSR